MNNEATEQKVMKIKHLTIQNVKAVNCVDTDIPLSGVTTFGGRNNQGKTTIITGTQYGLGGETYRPTNYRKDDAQGETFIDILLSDGIRVTRIGDTADLKVVDETGKAQGQTLLNKYISKMALDFPRFINGTDRERRDILLNAMNLKEQVDAIEDVIDSEYEERTMIGRIADQKEKAVREMPFYEGVPAKELSPTDILKRINEVNMRNAKIQAAKEELDKSQAALVKYIEIGDKLESDRSRLATELDEFTKRIEADKESRLASIEAQIKQLMKEKEEVGQKAESRKTEYEIAWKNRRDSIEQQKAQNDKLIEDLTDKITAAEEQDFSLEDTSVFKQELDALTETNRKVRANLDREKANEDAIAQRRKYEDKTAIIEEKRRELDALLVGADLPYPGLTVENRVIHLNGKAWDCMSESMKIRVGCAIVSRINPSCKFMLVDKLEQLDSESLAELDQFAKDHDIQIIGTRVTTDPNDCSIIIKNGWIEGLEGKLLETPKVVARRSKKTVANAAPQTEELPLETEPAVDTPVLATAYKGGETDAMKKAKELLARKRKQILENTTPAQ